VTSSSELVQQLNWRYAVKQFDPDRKVDDERWHALEQALVLSPSSYGLQPWKFIVVTDPAIKSQMPAMSWNQSQPKDCSHMVIMAALRSMEEAYVDKFMQSVVDNRGGTIDSLKGYKSMIMNSAKQPESVVFAWNSRQVYIALGQLMTAAALLQVDTCPMEGIDPNAYDKLLGLEGTPYTTIVGCAVGYRHPDDKYASTKKVRFATSEVVQHQ
jgi:nitroreductase